MKLVLFEGIPGSGKSTLARFVANQFERNGYKCSLFLETTYMHPIIQAQSFETYNDFIDSYIYNWDRFFSRDHDEDIVVMESALFQNPIVHLLHKDVDRPIIKSLLRRVCECISKEESSLIYLYQEDAEAAIHNTINIRGKDDWLLRKHNEYKHEPYFMNRQEQGPDSHISFFLDYAALANEVAKEGIIDTLHIENSEKNYNSYEQQILNKYGLINYRDPIVDTNIKREYAGTYFNKEMNLTLIIELVDNNLIIFGNRDLKAKSSSQFYLNDMSVVVTFVKSEGKITRLLITEKDLYANQKEEGTPFERIA
jgi:hypothetical protein